MNCLVALELKIDRFESEHLGKLGFYLEALDRDIKKPHENPSIGVLLCASKDIEVVEYALSRALSPALNSLSQTDWPVHLIETFGPDDLLTLTHQIRTQTDPIPISRRRNHKT